MTLVFLRVRNCSGASNRWNGGRPLGHFRQAVVHPCVRAGKAVIQFAKHTDNHSEYAIKFFLDRESFLLEAALYAACLSTMPAGLSACANGELGAIWPRAAGGVETRLPEAVAQCLPKLEAVADCESGQLHDPRGRSLPSCIVMERGESLHEWADRAKPEIFTTLAVGFRNAPICEKASILSLLVVLCASTPLYACVCM